MTFFDRSRVSPNDVIWDQAIPAEPAKAVPPVWSALTHPVLAPPAGARPFYLCGPKVQINTPFVNQPVPGASLIVNIGEVLVVKNVYIAFEVTLAPEENRFWSLTLDGIAIGNGYGTGYQFCTGWSTTNGLILFPVDLRVTTTGTLQLSVTDTTNPGTPRVFTGLVQGWVYPAQFDAGIDTPR